MKNKKQLYLLIPAVIIIWGLVIFKIYDSLNSSGSPVISPMSQTIPPQSTNSAEDSYTLLLNYRDPFKVNQRKILTKRANVGIAKQNQPIQKKNNNSKEEKIVNWSEYGYLGMVQNKNSKEMAAMITIRDAHFVVKEKDKIKGLQIRKILRDSIYVDLNGKEKYIVRN